MADSETPLYGNVTQGVVRVGDTVRRPAGPWTDTVDALLVHLSASGFDGAPRALGRDDHGRQVLEFIQGVVGTDSPSYSLTELTEIGRTLSDLHTATASFIPPVTAMWQQAIPPDRNELICHNDPAPWNLVRADGRWVFIDWDFAGPGSRLWDLAYCVQTTAPVDGRHHAAEAGPRLRALVDGYELDEAGRTELAHLLAPRAAAMRDMLDREARAGTEPWSRIWREDGAYWSETTDYLARNVTTWISALL